MERKGEDKMRENPERFLKVGRINLEERGKIKRRRTPRAFSKLGEFSNLEC